MLPVFASRRNRAVGGPFRLATACEPTERRMVAVFASFICQRRSGNPDREPP